MVNRALEGIWRVREHEIDAAEAFLKERVGAELSGLQKGDLTLSRTIAIAYLDWKARTNNGKNTHGYTLLRDWPKMFAKPAIEDARRVREGLRQLEDMPNSFALSIKHKLEAKGFSVDQMNVVLSVVDDELASIEAEASQVYEQWANEFGVNKPGALSYLRLALDDCLQPHLSSRNGRSKMIATLEIALGVVAQNEFDAERNRLNSFLRQNSR